MVGHVSTGSRCPIRDFISGIMESHWDRPERPITVRDLARCFDPGARADLDPLVLRPGACLPHPVGTLDCDAGGFRASLPGGGLLFVPERFRARYKIQACGEFGALRVEFVAGGTAARVLHLGLARIVRTIIFCPEVVEIHFDDPGVLALRPG